MILEVDDLSISFETKHGILEATKNISFHLKLGETLGIVGESGCGKSITNLALMGLLPDTAITTAKKVNFNGHDLMNMKERAWQKIRGGEISMIFQDPMSALNPSFTVGYQIDETLKIHKPELTKKERYELSIDLLNQVGIPAPEDRIKSFAHELSGGMSQRVMIAMAIACQPKLLIADEPTTALDVTIQDQIMKLLKDLQEKYNMAMILVTHDLGVVAQNADRIQVMYAGEIVESAPTRQIIDSPTHPYTFGLINSLPGVKTTGFREELPSIKGMVPDLRNRPNGCQFHPRCEFAKDDCRIKDPALVIGKEKSIRCHYPLSGGQS